MKTESILRALIFSILGLLILFYLLQYSEDYYHKPERQVARFQKNFLKQQQVLYYGMEAIQELLTEKKDNYWPGLEESVKRQKAIVQIYKNDTLFFWNSRMISNEIAQINARITDTVIFQKTGWYLLHRKQFDTYDVFLLKQIKSEYAYNNIYLPNTIDPNFSTAANIGLTQDLRYADHIIYDQDEKACLGLVIQTERQTGSNALIGLFILFVLLYLAVIGLAEMLYQKVKKLIANDIALFIFFALDLIILRLIDHYSGFPGVLKTSFIFNPSGEAIAGLTTPGDFLLNALIICSIALKFRFLLKEKYGRKLQQKDGINPFIAAIFVVVTTWVLFYLAYSGFNTLEYDVFYGVRWVCIHGMLIISGVLILLLAIFIITSGLISHTSQTIGSFITLLFVSAIIIASILLLLPNYRWMTYATLLYAISLTFIYQYLPGSLKSQPLKILLVIVVLSTSTAILMNDVRDEKKDIHQLQTAQKLAYSGDSDLEIHFAEVAGQIHQDETVIEIIRNYPEPEENLSSYFQGKYFKSFKDKYSIQVSVCAEGEILIEELTGDVYNCVDYLDDKINFQGIPTVSAGLYRIDDRPERIYYMGKLEIFSADNPDARWDVFIEFFYSYIPEGLGFMELLVDNSQSNLDLTGYSFAEYDQGELTYGFSEFPYNTSMEFMEDYPVGKPFNMMGHRHIKLNISGDNYLVLSREHDPTALRVVFFSGIFLILLTLTIIYYLLVLLSGGEKVLQLNFRNRLQLIFISTISLIIVILAVITLYYAEISNKRQIMEQLEEKTASVLVELDGKLMDFSSLEMIDPEEIDWMLSKFSSVFFSDINLYNPSGQLVASSRPEIFTKGLLSENINPVAYEELMVKNKLLYVSTESIGEVEYYSAYVPLNLGNTPVAAIVNLPFFARQTEVSRSYQMMLFTFINMFVILGIIGTLMALLLSRVLTRPLLLLQESLRTIQIDRENERLEWSKNDEIGELISEYNQMVDKLEQSAELLKHSERESAWREVAQQIAHEIKNPLTPMKLNVQYLQKAYEENDPAVGQKIHSISDSLISQIESLNQVAEMFSNFAKTNAGNLEKVDLARVIRASVSLYDNQPDLQIVFDKEAAKDAYYTLGIEKDLIRVFNNLIKNAIQSMEEKREKHLKIDISQQEGYFVVTVSDRGKGIPHEAKQNIFKPYFTTKSGGTGLGLAIVKTIMKEIGGEIRFEDREGGGTTFKLYFKANGE